MNHSDIATDRIRKAQSVVGDELQGVDGTVSDDGELTVREHDRRGRHERDSLEFDIPSNGGSLSEPG